MRNKNSNTIEFLLENVEVESSKYFINALSNNINHHGLLKEASFIFKKQSIPQWPL